MPALTFDSRNREVRFVAPWFAQQTEAPVKVSWNIKRGDAVSPGDEVGEITWGDGSASKLMVPARCQGAVEAANRTPQYATLDKRPAQWAIRMAL
jgi:hypothetical protein